MALDEIRKKLEALKLMVLGINYAPNNSIELRVVQSEKNIYNTNYVLMAGVDKSNLL